MLQNNYKRKKNTLDQILNYKSIWISDLHLGIKGCRSEMIMEFLKYTRSDKLYLVGDIVDVWALKSSWYWPQEHNNIIQKLLRKARHGTKVFYLVGNHDEVLRKFIPIQLGNVEILNQIIHHTVDGKKYLVVHGDQFDGVIQYAKWLSKLGSIAYELLIKFNRYLNLVRKLFGKEYWSLSKYLKFKVKNAVKFMGNYEKLVSNYAKKFKVNGIICGHIHHPSMKKMNNEIEYINDGDWVESCTALVEHFDGKLELIDWSKKRKIILKNDSSEEIFIKQNQDIYVAN